ENLLEESPYSEIDTVRLLSTKRGIETTLFDAYTRVANMGGEHGSQHTNKREEMTTDILTHSGGGEHRNAIQLLNFTWDPECCNLSALYWDQFWEAIRSANIVIENVDQIENTTQEYKKGIIAEARFIRAYAHYELWDQFGSIPIRMSTNDPLELPNKSSEEVIDFIVSEFLAIESILPKPGEAENYGRAHSGAVKAFLTKIYLNTHRWQEAAAKALEIMNNGYYELYPDYNEMFALENERNSEFIWVRPAATNVADARNNMTATAFPWGFYQ